LEKVRDVFRDLLNKLKDSEYAAQIRTVEQRLSEAVDAAAAQAWSNPVAENENTTLEGGARYAIKAIDGILMPVIDTENDTRDTSVAEKYLRTLVNTKDPFSTILYDAQEVFIGKDLPSEYKGSEYTYGMSSALRKVKMQAATNLDEMLLLAYDGSWQENKKAKHAVDAQNG